MSINEFGEQPESIESGTLKNLKERRDVLTHLVEEHLGIDVWDDLWSMEIANQGAYIREKYPNHRDIEAWYFFGGSPRRTMPFTDFPGEDSVVKFFTELESQIVDCFMQENPVESFRLLREHMQRESETKLATLKKES